MVSRTFRFLTVLLPLLGLLGCGKGGGGVYATVSGTVTHNGSPVDGARVEFHSTTEGPGGKRDVFATTSDSSGKYMVAAVGNAPGIQPGMYKVVITKFNIKGGNPNAGKEGFDAGQLDAQISDGQGPKSGITNALPGEYSSIASTKLSATVQEGKNENVDFALKGNAGK